MSADRELTAAYLDTGLLGTEDYLYYVPWMQATYIMAASKDALQYLPAGADINALTWEQLGEWCKTIYDKTGTAALRLPPRRPVPPLPGRLHVALVHRRHGQQLPEQRGGSHAGAGCETICGRT